MLGVQLSFNGDKLVVCNGVIVGMLVDENIDDCVGVLGVLNTEYSEIVRLIKDGLQKNEESLYWYSFCRIVGGELVIQCKGMQVDIKETIKEYCFPVKIDGIVVSYVRCKNVYIIKQSAIYVKRELTLLGVIK
jgi:hypothetical protein